MAKSLNLVGQRFGLYTAIRRGENRGRRSIWVCRCDCGLEREVYTDNLVRGNSLSCGCRTVERSAKRGAYSGGRQTREYRIWAALKERCLNPRSTAYMRYGGRGIDVCARWRDSFDNFLADMGKCPPKYSIDRVNGDGNYEPGNCRWADQKTQARNRAYCPKFEMDGKMQTLAEWADELGVPRSKLYTRVRSPQCRHHVTLKEAVAQISAHGR